MRVLVTGGGGYLGSWVTRRLLELGDTVRVFDRFCYGRAGLDGLRTPAELEVVEGDIRRLQEVPDLFVGVDATLHLAGLANDPSCDLDEDFAIDVNVESTVELARQAMQRGIRRFVFSSSCSVYGHGVFEILDEQSPTRPVSVFAKSKLAAEQALLGMRGESFEPVISRAGTLFGYSPRMRFDLAVNQMTATAVRQGFIEVRGGGSQWRPFLHVVDAADALIALLRAPAALVGGEVFNVGDDRFNTRIIDLAERVAAQVGGVKVEKAIDDDDLRTYRVRFGKLRERLGFEASRDIAQGVDEVREFLGDPQVNPHAACFFNVQRLKELRNTPVDEGGEPTAARFIPLTRPGIGPEEEEAVLRALRSGWLTSGPQIPAFERVFAEQTGAPEAVAVSSCTAALHLCMVVLGVGPGDEVITSPITWASTGNTLLNMGAKVVFADVDPDTLNIDPVSLERAITKRTKAIMPVDMAGQPCDLNAVLEIGQRHGIPVIEDAAHAFGAKYRGMPIGSVCGLTCFSFYAIKNITTMEGGMITAHDPEMAQKLRLLAANGMAASAWDRYSRSAAMAPQEVVTPGYKYAMSNVGAAMGLEQIKKWPVFKQARTRLALLYSDVLRDVEEITLPTVREEIEHAWHLFIIRLRLDRLNLTRNEIAHALRRENIGTGFNFYGLHLHRYYRETLGMRPEDLPNATQVSNEVLSLPLHPQLSDKDVRDVVTALKKVLSHARKRV